jgi:23S rRNA pseudouridine2605 synthase
MSTKDSKNPNDEDNARALPKGGPDLKKERAQKVIAASGRMSRRKAEEAIRDGRVSLNGEVFTEMGTLVDLSSDVLIVDGEQVSALEQKRTFLFYKPRGVVTTKDDPDGKPTIMDFFKDIPSVNPVGRLDLESEGLLLLTQDGDLLLKLTHPRYGVKKIYEVEVEGSGVPSFIQKLLGGVELSDGLGKFDECEELDWKKKFLVTVSEGRNRFVRRMFSAVGFSVIRLKRLRMGEYELSDMNPGDRREVFPENQE